MMKQTEDVGEMKFGTWVDLLSVSLCVPAPLPSRCQLGYQLTGATIVLGRANAGLVHLFSALPRASFSVDGPHLYPPAPALLSADMAEFIARQLPSPSSPNSALALMHVRDSGGEL
ncbi:hypothetical protein MVEN_01444100 [Mycena venus]|uniref:Uncharacterized protein n=1 Tax=Mycena venus TaxID=2733690 RepID=A0A8H7CTJ5_9AGAR|nr:hypothetical protein MVEN_01444100 [Mycena venus]